MNILKKLFRLAYLNILQELESHEFKWKTKSGKNRYNYSDDFNYYYQKYKEYYKYKHYNYSKYEYSKKKTYSGMSGKKSKLAQYYANLELPFGSSLEDVKRSWKKLLKKYHPDMFQDNIKKQKATILTQKLNEAYFELEKYLKETTK